jgi:hypothetical protein
MFSDAALDSLTRFFEDPIVPQINERRLPFKVTCSHPVSTKKTARERHLDFENQVVLDWARNSKRVYRIGGLPVRVINRNRQPEVISDVKAIFKKELFMGLPEKHHNQFFKLLIPYIHQGGVIHNTGTLLSTEYQAKRVNARHRLQFATVINFYPIKNGIGIVERNRLNAIHERVRADGDIKEESFTPDATSPIEVLTYSSINFDSAKNKINISPPQVEINVKSKRMAAMLDCPPVGESDYLVEATEGQGSNIGAQLLLLGRRAKERFGKKTEKLFRGEHQDERYEEDEEDVKLRMLALSEQLVGLNIMLSGAVEESDCRRQSFSTSYQERHSLFISLIEESDKLSDEFDSLLKAIEAKKKSAEFIQTWFKGQLDFEEYYKSKALEERELHIKRLLRHQAENEKKVDAYSKKLDLLISHFKVLPDSEKDLVFDEYEVQRKSLVLTIKQLKEHEIALVENKDKVPSKTKIEEVMCQIHDFLIDGETKIADNISCLEKSKQEALRNKAFLNREALIDVCEAYDIGALSVAKAVKSEKTISQRMSQLQEIIQDKHEKGEKTAQLEPEQLNSLRQSVETKISEQKAIFDGLQIEKDSIERLIRFVETHSAELNELSKIKKTIESAEKNTLLPSGYSNKRKSFDLNLQYPNVPLNFLRINNSINIDSIVSKAVLWQQKSLAHQKTGESAANKKKQAYQDLVVKNKGVDEKIKYLIWNYAHPPGGRFGQWKHCRRKHMREAENLFSDLKYAKGGDEAYKQILSDEILRLTLDEKTNYEGSYFRRLLTAYHWLDETASPISLLNFQP